MSYNTFTFADQVTLVGTQDGTNKIFFLPGVANPPKSIKLYLDGLVQHQDDPPAGITGDFHYDPPTGKITFAIAPPANAPLFADFRY